MTKCYGAIAVEFNSEYLAVLNVTKLEGDYTITLKVQDVIANTVVISKTDTCAGCKIIQVVDKLKTLAGGEKTEAVAAPEIKAPAEKEQPGKAAGGNEMERDFWNSVKDSDNPEDFKAYLESYPKGVFAQLANKRLTAMRKAVSDKEAAEKATAEKKAAAEKAEEAKHPGMVYVKRGSSGFYMDKYLVTQNDYQRVIGANPSHFSGCSNCPVEQVSWFDADTYCRKVGKVLPKEDDWEYSASEGGKNTWAGTSNESELGEYAWYSANAGGKTHPVGEKRPNGLGLYDMSGNVWEWTADWDDNKQKYRVIRGGSWYSSADDLRVASRSSLAPDNRALFLGFRCVQYQSLILSPRRGYFFGLVRPMYRLKPVPTV
ncbi:MAG: formylglycine-generating enzyme family protein [Nitrospinae bacterium]|nr:formylglycine-generating enzyme family protein [Nitrospinota bacterium]